jgi:release factor glutamine methyltransferase
LKYSKFCLICQGCLHCYTACMQIGAWLKESTRLLEQSGIGTARLDALVLLEDVTGIDRTKLLAKPEHELLVSETARLTKLLNKRSQHVPLAYVRGRTEFYGREFVITPAVLEPRPESETMIDLLKSLSDLPKKPRIADVGAGSGALGITACLEVPHTTVELLEIDEKAAAVAKINVDKFTPKIEVKISDLLMNSGQSNDALLCNLPYVPDDYQINRAATHEPDIALFGGPDGLNLYRKLFKQVSDLPTRPLYILSESLPPQHAVLGSIASQHGYREVESQDFIQVFRLDA